MPAGLPISFVNVTMPGLALWAGIITGSILLGNAIDRNERDRCDKFRDKSKIFATYKQEGEAPSWGKPYKSMV